MASDRLAARLPRHRHVLKDRRIKPISNNKTMMDQTSHRPDRQDSLRLRYDELPPLKDLLGQLDCPVADVGIDGKRITRRWYSKSKLKEYVLPNLFPSLYMLAVLAWVLVVGFHVGPGRLTESIQRYGLHALEGLFFLAMIQLMWNAVGLVRFYFNLSSNYISSVQSQMAQEALLAYRLNHLPPKALRHCQERIELEIDANERAKIAVAVLPAIPILIQISTYIREKSDLPTREAHCQQIQPEVRPKPSSQVSSWSVSLGTAVVILVFLDLFFVRMGRQLKRLAYVLKCAEREYSSR
jgi:hypothetical protein